MKKVMPYLLLLTFSSIAVAQTQTPPTGQSEEQQASSDIKDVSIEERSENYIRKMNEAKSLNLTPFQIDKWKNILIEYHRVMSEAETDEHKAYYQRKYKEALNETLREYQVQKIKQNS